MSGRRLLEKTAAALDLPPEVALDAVKLSVVGGNELRAANHRGILIYESERIVFRCRGGARCVTDAQTGRWDARDVNCWAGVRE